jgi:DNA transposition AAA+ family ATPase
MTLQNTEIFRRISVAGLHRDDAREIIRIFPVLTEEKQLQILETWSSVIASIKLHREELEQEKEILLIKALENIESDLEAYGRTLVQSGAKKDLSGLKFQI